MRTHALVLLALATVAPLPAHADLPPGPGPAPRPRPQPPRDEPSYPPTPPPSLVVSHVALPGGPPVIMDYLAVEAGPGGGRVWVPAGNTGRVDVVDAATGKLTEIPGWPTAKRGERLQGPSSATVGEGVVYVGSRADSSVCAVDVKTLKRGACVTLPSSPDGLAYVATTHEVWVTTPHDKSLTFLDVSHPAAPALHGALVLPGEPEGYAVDAARGLFYTNLEDGDRTLVIDVKARKVVSTWQPHCGEAGPRGVAIDAGRKLVFVACTDHVVTLSSTDGAPRGQIPTGAGVDNIDYLPATKLLYVASGKSATLTVAAVSDSGALSPHAKVATAAGVRTVVVDALGRAFMPDIAGGRLLEAHAAR